MKHIKILLPILVFTLLSFTFLGQQQAQGQVLEPVKWTFDTKTLPNGFHQLFFTAKMEKGWYVYSQDIADGGPIPTTFEFEESKDYQLKGKIKEKGNVINKFDEMFDMDIKKYPDEVKFVATIKPLKDNFKVKGFLTFMTCDDSKCLPPEDVDFSFDLKKAAEKAKSATAEKLAGQASNTGHSNAANSALGGTAAAIGEDSRILEPVKWDISQEPLGNNEYLLKFKAKIDKGWYVYSQKLKSGGPIPTSFEFDTKDGVELVGDAKEIGNLIEKQDKVFKMLVRKYQNSIEFRQKVKVNKDNGKIGGYFTFMTCDDGRCLPPEDVDFSFDLKKDNIAGAANTGGTASTGSSSAATENSGNSGFIKDAGAAAGAAGTAATGIANTTDKKETTDKKKADKKDKKEKKHAVSNFKSSIPVGPNMFDGIIQDCGANVQPTTGGLAGNPAEQGTKNGEEEKGRSNWLIFVLGFLGGFAALLTPCVFPMIPLTVSFFTKQSDNKKKGLANALIYALSIIVIYVALGILVTVLFGADALNALSTNPWFNLGFFIIFVVFAISFFGYFEITLPNWLISKSDTASDKGGLFGIFFMAFTLALVSFSCTGPIIGTLLVEAAVGGERIGPVIGMFGFALALALPFFLFALFPGWLNSLPSSGGWLDTVKKVLGFIELIFALKFLSNADLVPQLGLLPREIFLGIWALLLFGLGIYLLGKIKFPHEPPKVKLTPVRVGLSALSIGLGLLLIPGILLKPIPLIGGLVSGFPPPTFYNISNLWGGNEVHEVHDIEEGLAIAKKQGKPLLVDFTGWACVNCRKMEENVWPEMEEVMDKYTLVSLYVDETVKLDKEDQFTYDLNGKKKKVRTIGNKWSYLETKCFGTNTQPYYVLLDHNGKHLINPKAYTPDVEEYRTFLEQGVENFRKGKNLLSSK